MSGDIVFKEVTLDDPDRRHTWKRQDAVAVIRNGRQVALLPEFDRLRRVLKLPLKEIEDTFDNFSIIMGREPTNDETEFWKAILDFKRGQRTSCK